MAIPSKAFKEINKVFIKDIKYGKLTTSERSELLDNIIAINDKYKVFISPLHILEMRDTYIYLLSKTKGTSAHKVGERILSDYKNNIKIIDISKKYKLPPMSIVYQILIEMKNESHEIEKIIKKRTLPKDIKPQMPKIMEMDPIFWFSLHIPSIHTKINKLKCPYQLNYDLKKNGKYPDILFDNQCSYKHKKFNWIVFKPYLLFDNSLHYHDIQKTINNFNRFGHGLILYNVIICSKSFIKKINAYVETYAFLD